MSRLALTIASAPSLKLASSLEEVELHLDESVCSCLIYNDDLKLLPSRTASINPLRPFVRPFSIDEAGEAGLGMYTRVALESGELICEERPIVVMPEDVVSNGWESMSRRLSSQSREAILALRNAHPPRVDQLEGALRTNFIGIELVSPTSSTQYRALFPVISRANHSCCSNGFYFFNPRTFALELRANRKISINEEIHIQYIDVLAPKIERQTLLQHDYFFLCQCPSCALPTGSTAQLQSDHNRGVIQRWFDEHQTFEDWLGEDLAAPQQSLLDDAMELLMLVRAEGLHGMQRFALDLLCACLAALGDGDGLRLWANEAREAARMMGDEHPMVAYYEQALEDPTSLNLWNLRGSEGDERQ